MSALCANTDTQMLSRFIDSSVDNVLLQANRDLTSRFLNSAAALVSLRLDGHWTLWQIHCCMAAIL